jgi:hypothetical protein
MAGLGIWETRVFYERRRGRFRLQDLIANAKSTPDLFSGREEEKSMRTIVALLAAIVAGSIVHATEPVSVHAGGDFGKMSREECQAKALDALREQKFPHAEIAADGTVVGRNAKSTVLVFGFPYRDGVVALVAAASKDNAEAERLRTAIRDSVLDASHEADANSIKQVKHAEVKNDFSVHYAVTKHGFLPVVRFFDVAAAIAMEKHGLQTSAASKMMVFGGNSAGGVAAILVPGANEVSVQLLVIGVSADEKEAERLQKTVSAEVMKVLLE